MNVLLESGAHRSTARNGFVHVHALAFIREEGRDKFILNEADARDNPGVLNRPFRRCGVQRPLPTMQPAAA